MQKEMPTTRIERAIFALQVRRLTTWPSRLGLSDNRFGYLIDGKFPK